MTSLVRLTSLRVTLIAIAALLAGDGGCVGSPSGRTNSNDGGSELLPDSGGNDGAFAQGVACGTALLPGRTDHSGTEARLTPGDYTAISDVTGKFCFSGLTAGSTYTLSLHNGLYQEELTGVRSDVYPMKLAFPRPNAQPSVVELMLLPGRRLTAGCFAKHSDGWLNADGTRLLVECDDKKLGSLPVDGGPLRELANYTDGADATAGVRFAILREPNLVFGEAGRLMSVPAAGGTIVRLALDVRTGDAVHVTSDGANILFLSGADRLSSGQLFTVPTAGGTPIPLSTGKVEIRVPLTQAADGARVVFNEDNTLTSALIGGGGKVTLGKQFRYRTPIFSPDFGRVVFATGQSGRLLIVSVDGSGLVDLGPGDDTFDPCAFFSPDGTRLMIYGDKVVELVPAVGGTHLKVGENPIGGFGFVGNDKTHVLFIANGSSAAAPSAKLMLGSLDGAAAVPLGTLPPGIVPDDQYVKLTPDRAKVAFLDAYNDLKLGDLDAGSVTTVVAAIGGDSLGSGALPRLAWSPDGQWLVYGTKCGVTCETYQVVATDGTKSRSLGSMLRFWLFSPDGKRMIVANNEFNASPLRVLTLGGETLTVADRWNRSVDLTGSSAPIVAMGVAWLDADRFIFDNSGDDLAIRQALYVVDLR